MTENDIYEITRWVETVRPLTQSEVALAKACGVESPEDVAIFTVNKLPLCKGESSIPVGALARVLGHCVLILKGHETPRVLSHELRHVYQVESGLKADETDAKAYEYLGERFLGRVAR
jgi:hypothetical protein